MYPTLEVRWFYMGAVPSAVVDWFHSVSQSAEAQLVRTDYYLRLPGNHSLSIKLRQSRIEIKQRQHHYGLHQFSEVIVGALEVWRKWSLEVVETNQNLDRFIDPTSAWTPVSKERLFAHHQVLPADHGMPSSVEGLNNQGCDIELANIQCRGETWWSIALEAYGHENTLRSSLIKVGGQFFQSDPPYVFTENDSCGYPSWLDRLSEFEQ